MTECSAKISSIYHGSCVDGIGIRSVVFFSGCNMRCPFCHNPETLYADGEARSLSDIINEINKYKVYYKKKGGVTLSGGEPFLQLDFCIQLVKRLKEQNINVIVETNGLILSEELLSVVDGVRLDIKNVHEENEISLLNTYAPFLDLCKRLSTPVTLTNVLVPTRNLNENSLKSLRILCDRYDYPIEFLAFRKTCVQKYRSLGIPFPYEYVPECSGKDVEKAKSIFFGE
ncbi:MAG: radical SAM protein [Clostridia bacterium]|nr:radical SAM protein [Clostridia bacterium]